MKECLTKKISLRVAEPQDLPHVFELVDSYADELVIDRIKTKRCLRDIVYIRGGFFVEYEGRIIGGIAGYILPCMFNDDVFFNVGFFYVRKEFRYLTSRIIDELEFALLSERVNKIVFGILDGPLHDKRIRFFKMMGYERLETHVTKVIVKHEEAKT